MAQQTEADLTAKIREAEEAAGIPSDADLYGEFLTDQPVDPDAEPPVTPPTGPVAETATAEPMVEEVEEVETPPATLLAGKYKTVEDLERGYLEAQRRIGEQANEVGELRKLGQEFEQLRAQVQQPPMQMDEATISWFDELAEQNPQQAVQVAMQQNSGPLYERAMEIWYQTDTKGAARFEQGIAMQQFQQNLQQTIEPQIASATQVSQQAELGRALETVIGRHEDFGQVIGSLDEGRLSEIVQNGFPVEVLQGLTGNQDAKERVYETLYRWVKAEQAGTLAEAAEEVALSAQTEARERKQAATVASASQTTPPLVPEDEQARQIRVWREQSPSLREGWKGRESRR